MEVGQENFPSFGGAFFPLSTGNTLVMSPLAADNGRLPAELTSVHSAASIAAPRQKLKVKRQKLLYTYPMLGYALSSPLAFLIWAAALIIAVAVHEFAHAWAAEQLGDPTPRLAGRLTLNPLAHLDPLGTISMLLVGFGWGKPVPFDPFNLANPRRDGALISLAGPASNLLLAVVLAVILKFSSLLFFLFPPFYLLATLMKLVITLSVVLAIFNLIPVHPLDGGKILVGFLPADLAERWDRTLSEYGLLLLFLLILPFAGGSLASYVISPIVRIILNLLLAGGTGVLI